jgi:hypothetical protein
MQWMVAGLAAMALAAAMSVPASADEAAQAAIQSACGTNLDLPPGTCPCLAAKAGSDLDDTQQAWLAASLSEQTDEALAIKDEMDPVQAMQAGMFMVRAPGQCAGGG